MCLDSASGNIPLANRKEDVTLVGGARVVLVSRDDVSFFFSSSERGLGVCEMVQVAGSACKTRFISATGGNTQDTMYARREMSAGEDAEQCFGRLGKRGRSRTQDTPVARYTYTCTRVTVKHGACITGGGGYGEGHAYT